jgi:hypothetical protein
VIKTYPRESRYAVERDDGRYIYFENPITFTIISSEEVVLADNITKLYLYKGYDQETGDFQLLKTPELLIPNYTSSLTMTLEMTEKLNEMDSISFSSYLTVRDTLDNFAKINFVKIKEDVFNSKKGVNHTFRNSIMGEDKNSVYTLNGGSIKLYDTKGELIKRIQEKVEIRQEWVAPYDYENGSWNPDAPCVDESKMEQFPKTCLASLALGTYKKEGAYKTKIFIYDHLGQYIDSWEQRFGFCGEFENLDRVSLSEKKDYFVQDLIWDLKTHEGRAVGGGVYFWKIQVQFEDGKSYEIFDKLGVLKGLDECEDD